MSISAKASNSPAPKRATANTHGHRSTPLPALPSDTKAITDLSIYSHAELLELRDRQEHLLVNKKRLATLPDKGIRIRELFDRIVAALAKSDAVHEASEIFSQLNIASTGISVTTQMEWNGRATMLATTDADATPAAAAAAADDDETADERNPLRLLAQSRQQAKLVHIEAPPETLITDADRQAIAEFAASALSKPEEEPLEPHAQYMCSIDGRHPGVKAKFLPHKSINALAKSPKHSLVAAVKKPTGGTVLAKWENTSATPPQLRHPEIVVLSLGESIEVQREQQKAMKILEEQHAVERLKSRSQLAAKLQAEIQQDVDHSGPQFATYRNGTSADDDEEDNDENYRDSAAEDYDEDEVASDGDNERQL